MKNKLRYFFLILIYSLLTLKTVDANEPFIFNVTEIEILENGDQINGYKGGTVISDDDSKIFAEKFFCGNFTTILSNCCTSFITINLISVL